MYSRIAGPTPTQDNTKPGGIGLSGVPTGPGGLVVPGSPEFTKAHFESDVNLDDNAQHHTLGYRRGQAASGIAVDKRFKISESAISAIQALIGMANQEMAAVGGTYAPGAAVSGQTPVGLADFVWTAPPSGKVRIGMSMFIKSGATINTTVAWPITRLGNVLRAGTIIRNNQALDQLANYNAEFVRIWSFSVISGLTPGASYNTYPSCTCGSATAQYTQGFVRVEPLI